MGFVPPFPDVSKAQALEALLPLASEEPEFLGLKLSDFPTYIDRDKCPNCLQSLHHLATSKMSHSIMYFDGVLSAGGLSYYV